jgi:hypothetical protein
MKNRNSILTHSAVFAAGVALAMVGYRVNSSPPEDPAVEAAMRTSSRRTEAAGGAASAETRSAASRDRRDAAAAKAGRTGEPAVERMAAIVQLADPLDRQLALMALLERLGPDEFAAVAEQYRTMDHYSGSGGEFDMILRGWAKADPLAALEYTTKLGSRGASAMVLSAWAGRDPAAAESWAIANHKGDGPNPFLEAVIRGLAPYDIAHATQLAQSMPASDEQREAVDSITRALFMQGLDKAMAYPSSIEDPKLRAGFISAVAKRLVDKDPAQAGTWLASMKDADDQNRAARRVAEALAAKDPQDAASWLTKLQPAARAEAARGIIPRMSAGDITGTAQWLNTLAGIPNYDRVVEEYVWSCDGRAPEQSAAWIRGISNPEQQTQLYHRMLGEWAKRDANAVKNWVASNQVPESVARRFKR